MIDALVCEVIDGSDRGVIVQTGSMLWDLTCSDYDTSALLACIGQGQRQVYTHLEVDENEMVLIGFNTREAQVLYKSLKEIHGIGRSIALKILNGGEPRDVIRAVMTKDQKYLSALPNLGPKRVLNLITELQKRWTGAPPRSLPVPLSEWIQARDVLVEKGLTVDDAEERLFAELDHS